MNGRERAETLVAEILAAPRPEPVDWTEDTVLGKPANRAALDAYDGGATRAAAARQAGVSRTTVSRLVDRRAHLRRAGVVR